MLRRTLGKASPLRNTCDFCTQSKLRCDHGKPSCRRCFERNQPCVYSTARRPGRPPKTSARIDTTGKGISRAGDIHQNSHQSRSPATLLSASQYGQQPGSSSTLGSGSADSTASNPDQEDTTCSNIDLSHSAEYAIEFESDFGFDVGNALSGNLTSNFPSLMLHGEVEGGLPTPQMANEGVNPSNSDLLSPAGVPLSMAYFASLDKPLELESQGRNRQSSIGRPDRFFLSDAVETERSLEEGSVFLEASTLINAVTNGNKSGHSIDTRNHRLCCCSVSLNTLQVLCFHPVLSQQNGCPPLDILLLLEDYTHQLYAGVLTCSTCQSRSLHSLVSLCVCTDLIIEMLKRAVQNLLSHRENVMDSKVRLDYPEREPGVYVGQTCLDDQLRQSCVRGLLNHRISRLAAALSQVAKLSHRRTGSLVEAFGTVIKGVLCKTESLLGMMEV